MNLDYIGAEQSFTVLKGVAPEYELEFERDDMPLDVSNVTFDGVLTDSGGGTKPILVEHVSAERNVLRLVFPVEGIGAYDYEIGYSSENAGRYRLAFGKIHVLSTRLALEEGEDREFDVRRVLVKLPAKAGGHIQLKWRAGLAVMAAALDAKRAAARLDAVDETLVQLDAQVEEFRVFTAKWDEEVASVLVLNPATGTIWIAGRDTGLRYQGDSGRAPRVNAYGFWEVFENGAWVTLPERAVGRDGRDGAMLRRVLLEALDDLPAEEERDVLYYVPAGDGFNVYAWVEPVGWLCVGADPYGIASTTSLGMVQLGIDSEVSGGAPVGLDRGKRLSVPRANYLEPGVVMASSAAVSEDGGRIHVSASGTLLVDVATVEYAGAVRIGSTEVVSGGGIVALNAAGQLEVVRGSASRAGAVQLSSSYKHVCPPPYKVSIGEDEEGRLAACLTSGGAVRSLTPDEWRELKPDWLPEDAFPVPGAPHIGLVTGPQFEQGEDGLVLRSATSELLAGVYMASGNDDNRDQAVLPAKLVARKADVYSKEEADGRFVSAEGGATRIVLCGLESIPPAAEQAAGVIYLGY